MEYSDYIDKLRIKENERWFKSYVKIPLIIAIIIGIFFFVWGIVDATTFQKIVYKQRGDDILKLRVYGFLEIESRIGAELIWWIMGAFLSVGTYFFLKIILSPKILTVLYLRKIKQDLEKEVLSNEVKASLQEVDVKEWVCPKCGEKNSYSAKNCTNCFEEKP